MNAAALALLTLVAVLLALSALVFHQGVKSRQREHVSRMLDRSRRHAMDMQALDAEAEQSADNDSQKTYWTLAANLPLAPEIRRTLREAGYAGVRPRLVFALINLVLPVAVLVISLLMFGITGMQTLDLFLIFILVTFAFLIPRWILRWLAARRRRILSEEIPVVIQLLLMLLGAGLSIEHALRILRNESRKGSEAALLPEFSRELEILMHRIDAGGSLAEELQSLAGAVTVQELSDLAAVLRQVLRRGGDIRQSLSNLAGLIEDRRYTRMQEQAGEIAGKMSAVMILFMFPALVLFIAGPGFLAVLEGLRNAAS